jgi:iron complex outermembrane receptor protein
MQCEVIMTKSRLLAGCAAVVCLGFAGAAWAQDAKDSITTVDEVIVKARDKAGLLEVKPSDTVMGLDKPLIETARSATFVSATTLERYGIQTIDGLAAVSPGTFTASFYGVPGSLNIRGTQADNYFRGFRRIENAGTYSTPIDDAAQIDIVRGPPSPIYGPGKVGGFMNFTPKSAHLTSGYLTEPTGDFSATIGLYRVGKVNGSYSMPVKMGAIEGGVHIYGEWESTGDYYHGYSPEKTIGEFSGDFDLGAGFTTSFGYTKFHSDGDAQTVGWNRLTQNLIDNGTYITGRDTSVADLDHNGFLSPLEERPGGFYPFNVYTYAFGGYSDPFHSLDTGVGTTQLSRRTVYVSWKDFSHTDTNTAYFDLVKDLGEGQTLKAQLFYDDLDNSRFVSYGFPASFQSHVGEARLTYNFALDYGPATSKSFIGASYRYTKARDRQTFDSGLISVERRDIAFGATPTDIIASPFDTLPAGTVGLGWENDNRSTLQDSGLFATTDIYLWENLNLTLGGRYDFYQVKSQDTGLYSFQPTGEFEAGKGKGTYSASLSYKTPWGVMPYFTYAETSALETGQAGDIPPSLIAPNSTTHFTSNGWLSNSDLTEAGVKFQLLKGTLVGSLAAYRQDRTELNQGAGGVSIVGTKGKGVEFELRWLASNNFSFTLTASNERTDIKNAHVFAYLPSAALGVAPADALGGAYVTFDLAGTFPSLAKGYKYSLIPDTVASFYGTYTSNEHGWGQVGATAGVMYSSKTSGFLPGAVVLPDYATVNVSGFYRTGPYTVSANIDNLFDKLYFTPESDTYYNLAALPGRGRQARITLKARF